MPIIYRSRPTLDRLSPEPQPTDADDSIVLSDLVRTGEASRLRRRGAIRLDHNQPPPEPEQTEPQQGSAWRYVRQPRRNSQDDYHYTLFCGSEEADEFFQEESPFVSSPLPWPSENSQPPRRRSIRRSNGCGALVHLHAAPHQRLGVWTAKTSASDAVVAMDPSYFDRAAVAKIVRSSCGCIREGVGCAVCGNPLGTRYRPCKTAADGLFHSTRLKPCGPVHPEGPAYWHSHVAHSHNDADPSIYTFFASAVTSSPEHKFNSPKHQHQASSSTVIFEQQTADEDETTPTIPSNMLLDRLITASPSPLSDVDEDLDSNFRSTGEPLYLQVPNNIQELSSTVSLPQVQFDPDGDMDIEEPGSPDKSNEVLFLLER